MTLYLFWPISVLTSEYTELELVRGIFLCPFFNCTGSSPICVVCCYLITRCLKTACLFLFPHTRLFLRSISFLPAAISGFSSWRSLWVLWRWGISQPASVFHRTPICALGCIAPFTSCHRYNRCFRFLKYIFLLPIPSACVLFLACGLRGELCQSAVQTLCRMRTSLWEAALCYLPALHLKQTLTILVLTQDRSE